MRVFLDECIPIPLASSLTGHEVQTAKSMGWEAIANGALLTPVAAEFDVFVTSDSNIRYQQNLSGYPIAVVELSTNSLRQIRLSINLVQEAISSANQGTPLRVEIPYVPRPSSKHDRGLSS